MPGDRKVLYTDEFHKDVAKIKDSLIRSRIKQLVQRLIDNPISGKPLKYDYAGLRSLRIPPFRIIYEFNEKEKTVPKVNYDRILLEIPV
jgi:addiction module RelE/StbE family toxin